MIVAMDHIMLLFDEQMMLLDIDNNIKNVLLCIRQIMYTACQNYFFSCYSLPFIVVQIMFKEFFRIFFIYLHFMLVYFITNMN